MTERSEWIETNNIEPKEVKDCEYGFICWVDGMVDMVGVNDGISWDESSHFMPLYNLKTPCSPVQKI